MRGGQKNIRGDSRNQEVGGIYNVRDRQSSYLVSGGKWGGGLEITSLRLQIREKRLLVQIGSPIRLAGGGGYWHSNPSGGLPPLDFNGKGSEIYSASSERARRMIYCYSRGKWEGIAIVPYPQGKKDIEDL